MGRRQKWRLPKKGVVVAIVKASLSDIKQGSFVGSTGMPQADGRQKAIEVHIFPEAMRGLGEGHHPWDLRPQSTMTNANVEQMVAGVDGQLLTLKYKDGEKKILVTPDTIRLLMCRGRKSSSPLRRSRRTERFRPRASITARTGSGHRCERPTFLAMRIVSFWPIADMRRLGQCCCYIIQLNALV